MPIAWSSRISYLHVQAELSGKRREVYLAIRDWPGDEGPTIEDLADTLSMKECSICGRVNELRDECGAIEDAPMKMNRTGKLAKTYRAIVYREDEKPPLKPKQLTLI